LADNGSNSGFVVRFASALTSIGNDFGAPLALLTNNTERMRITAGGDVGIGTSSPDIFGRFYTRNVGLTSSGTTMLQINGTTYGGIDLGFNGTRSATMLAESAGFFLQTVTATPMVFLTNGTERMRLNSAGNLGLGVVPPSSDFTGVLQVRFAGHGLTGRDASDLVMSMNANHNGGGWQYGNTGAPASLYLQSGGAHIWVNAASGTAGNAITFAETMRITAAGNLGIGTASPSQPLTVQTGSVYAASFKSTVTSSASTAIAIGTFGSGAAGGGGDVSIRCYHHHAATSASTMAFEVNGNTEAMRIDSSGNLLVGTTSNPDSSRMVVSGGSITHASTQLNTRPGTATQYEFVNRNGAGFDFYVNNASNLATRITSAGDLLIGLTATPSGWGAASRIAVKQTNNGGTTGFVSYALSNDNAVFMGHDGTVGMLGVSYASTGSYTPLVFQTGGTERARIDSSGNMLVGKTATSVSTTGTWIGSGNINITSGNASGDFVMGFYNTGSASAVGSIQTTASATNFNTSSDARLKHDIVDAPEASGLIDAIKVRSFKWNADDSEQRYGFVAQELVEVAPEAVSVPADEDQMMGVDYSKLVPMLVKEIQSLRARVAQLEGN
jgi:hypothetical protein